MGVQAALDGLSLKRVRADIGLTLRPTTLEKAYERSVVRRVFLTWSHTQFIRFQATLRRIGEQAWLPENTSIFTRQRRYVRWRMR